jgi:hypothetical protein
MAAVRAITRRIVLIETSKLLDQRSVLREEEAAAHEGMLCRIGGEGISVGLVALRLEAAIRACGMRSEPLQLAARAASVRSFVEAGSSNESGTADQRDRMEPFASRPLAQRSSDR